MENKLFESRHIIRFPDCDGFNHLNNSRYLDYFINAREDHLRDFCHFDIYGYARKTGKSWVVGQHQVGYFFPAFLMETVIIQSVLLEWNQHDVLVELRMWDENKTRLKSFLWSRFIHYDLTKLKRIVHDESLTATFSPFEQRPEKPETFEQRLQSIKSKPHSEI